MPRPHKTRLVASQPSCTRFKPCGRKKTETEIIPLTIDQYESVRLADYEGLSHEEAALQMNVSRPTFTRLLEKARYQIARFLVEAHILSITGGAVHVAGCCYKKQHGACHDDTGRKCLEKDTPHCCHTNILKGEVL